MKRREYPKAIARICGGRDYPTIRGTVQFFQHGDGVLVEAEVWGLPRTQTGFFAFHIHEGEAAPGLGFPIPAATSIPAAGNILTMPGIYRRCWQIPGEAT